MSYTLTDYYAFFIWMRKGKGEWPAYLTLIWPVVKPWLDLYRVIKWGWAQKAVDSRQAFFDLTHARWVSDVSLLPSPNILTSKVEIKGAYSNFPFWATKSRAGNDEWHHSNISVHNFGCSWALHNAEGLIQKENRGNKSNGCIDFRCVCKDRWMT